MTTGSCGAGKPIRRDLRAIRFIGTEEMSGDEGSSRNVRKLFVGKAETRRIMWDPLGWHTGIRMKDLWSANFEGSYGLATPSQRRYTGRQDGRMTRDVSIWRNPLPECKMGEGRICREAVNPCSIPLAHLLLCSIS